MKIGFFGDSFCAVNQSFTEYDTYIKEIENFIYWLHGCFILNENISISLKKLMQRKDFLKS